MGCVPDQAGRPGLSRRLTAGLCAGLLLFQSGCHTFLPLQEQAPVPQSLVAVVLNDRGRALMGDRLGETIDRIEGTLVESSETAVRLQVSRTVSLQGSTAIWAGEEVVVQREGVRGFRTRQFSRGRTAMLSIAAVMGLVVIGATLTLLVGGGGRPGDGSPCTDCSPR
jgi:hypothetical protein